MEIDMVVREIGELTERELLIAGAAAYWCEGAESKPWQRRDQVIFINRDPGLIRLFLRFLELCGWGLGQLSFRLSIHGNADAEAATRFWAEVVGVPPERFKKPSLQKHNPKTVRKNVGDSYRGCLVVYAHRSARPYRRIEGLARGVMRGVVASLRTGQGRGRAKANEDGGRRRWCAMASRSSVRGDLFGGGVIEMP